MTQDNVSPNASLKEKATVLEAKQVSSSQLDLELNRDSKESVSFMRRLTRRSAYSKLWIHLLVGTFFTAWWLSIIVQPRHRPQWLIPTIIWGMIMVRLITLHCRVLLWLMRHVSHAWEKVVTVIYERILPQRYQRFVVGTSIALAVVVLGTFVTSESEFSMRRDRAISFLGCLVSILVLYATSANRSKIQWSTVIKGYLLQFVIALFVLRSKAGYDIFNFILLLARGLLGFAKNGVAFLTNDSVANLPMFFFAVIPAVVFFVAFVHIGCYYGWVQWGIKKFAAFFFWLMQVSGAEAIIAAASPFIGMGESAVLIKDLIPYLTKAELHQIMASGFSTISGAVLVGYIGMGLNAEALVSSCVMSIPALLATSKLRYPETETPLSCGRFEIPDEQENDCDKPQSVLMAFSQGATVAIRIAGTMIGQTMCIIALVFLINGVLSWFGKFWNIEQLSLELIFSYLLYPVAFLMGTPRAEIFKVSTLISTKFVQNDFVAYHLLLSDPTYSSMTKRSKLLTTYALCGFSNFGSVGITLGILNPLTNNTRVKDITSLVVSALLTGFVATLTSAAVAGMVVHDLGKFNI